MCSFSPTCTDALGTVREAGEGTRSLAQIDLGPKRKGGVIGDSSKIRSAEFHFVEGMPVQRGQIELL